MAAAQTFSNYETLSLADFQRRSQAKTHILRTESEKLLSTEEMMRKFKEVRNYDNRL